MLLDIFAPLICGGCVCIPNEYDRLNNLPGCIHNLSANIGFFTPSVSRLISPETVPCLKTILLGGEAVTVSDVERWSSSARVLNAYGPTETCILAVTGELSLDIPANAISTPLGCRAWVVNTLKSTELAPLGAIGELCIEGPNVARGYTGIDVSENDQSFIFNSPWLPEVKASGNKTARGPIRLYYTGDLAYHDTHGLHFAGRKDSNRVKIHGQRVELGEIEEAIRQLTPSNVMVAATVAAHQEHVQSLAAGLCVVNNPHLFNSSNLGADELVKPLIYRLRVELPRLLPQHVISDFFIPLSEIPVGTSGKLDRKALKSIFELQIPRLLKSELGSTQLPGTLTEIEHRLWEFWNKVLHLPEAQSVSSLLHFFHLGGDSMAALSLVTLAKHEGFHISVVDIFSHPTLGSMANLLGDPVGSRSEVIEDAEDQQALIATALNAFSFQPVPVETSQVDTVQTCTSMQELSISGTERFPSAHVAQFIFELSPELDLERLQRSFNRCADWFPALRTRIVREPMSNELLQVIQKEGTPVPWSRFQNSDLETVLAQDKNNPIELGGILQRVSVVTNDSSSARCRVWTLSHAAYDAWSLRLMLADVEKAYRNPDFKLDISLSFEKFVRYRTTMDSHNITRSQDWQLSIRTFPDANALASFKLSIPLC